MIIEDENTVLFKEEKNGNRIYVKLTDTPWKGKVDAILLSNHEKPKKRTIEQFLQQNHKLSKEQEKAFYEFSYEIDALSISLKETPSPKYLITPKSLHSFFPLFIFLGDNFVLSPGKGVGYLQYISQAIFGYWGGKGERYTISLTCFDVLKKGLNAKEAWKVYQTEIDGFLEKVSDPFIHTNFDIVVTAPTRLKKWFDKEFKNIDRVEDESEDIDLNLNLTSGRATTKGDTPAEEDLLGNKNLVKALAEMFADEKQETPLTMALLGNWGAGKTSIMKMVENELKKKEEMGKNSDRFIFSWFNAWSYEATENLSAGLAQEVMNSFVKKLSFFERMVLRLEFVIHEHGWKLLCILASFPIFLIIEFIGYSFADTNNTDNMLPGATANVSGFVVWGALFIGLIKKWSDHPIAANLETYLKLPTYGKHLGLIPVLKRHIETTAAFFMQRDWEEVEIKEFDSKFKWPFKFYFELINATPAIKKRRKGVKKDLFYIKLARLLRRFMRQKDVFSKRLILFVDDLDRCKTNTIIQALEAARLVMDIKNVIVVIGIDNRILFNAVGNYFEKLADESRSKEDIARDYLGKIVQIAVTLDRPSEDGIKSFIKEALFPEDSIQKKDLKNDKPEENPRELAKKNNLSAIREAYKIEDSEIEGMKNPISEGNTQKLDLKKQDENLLKKRGQIQEPEQQEDALKKEMKFSAEEVEQFEMLALKFGFRNPRQLLRMKNSYSLAKLIHTLRGVEKGNHSNLMILLFWLEFKGQWPKKSGEVIKELEVKSSLEHSDSVVNAVMDEMREFEINREGKSQKYPILYELVKRFVLPTA